jgi:putative oxidoreductase
MVQSSKTNAVKKQNYISKNYCEKKWNLLPLRIALGFMFIAAGLPKLIGLIEGTSQVPGYFATLQIPFPILSAWLVALIETIGGIFLIIGFFTFVTSALLAVIMIVAIITTTLSPIHYLRLTQHLVYTAGLIAIMFGNKFLHIMDCKCKFLKK